MGSLAGLFIAFLPVIAAVLGGGAALDITYDLMAQLMPNINKLISVTGSLSAAGAGDPYISQMLTFFQIENCMQIIISSITAALAARAAMYAAKMAQNTLTAAASVKK